MGPLANPRRLEAMQQITEDARRARRHAGHRRRAHRQRGNFFAPTVLTDVPLDSAKVFNEEPFGPMAAVRSVNTLDEAIAEANRLPFGLSAYAFTSSMRRRTSCRRRWRWACCGSTSRTRPGPSCRSAASRIPATAARAAPRRWRPT
jgi:succinate-semialdehyde dehydrogenase/glutarate-semialdehyde dehydrogenase